MQSLRPLLVLFGLIFAISVRGQTLPEGSFIDSSIFMLNDKPVELIRYRYGEAHIHFLAMHDTEKTGLMAAFKFMNIYGGSALELKYGQVRNIDFLDSLKEFSFDPNRIFTDGGAYLGLAKDSKPPVPAGLPGKLRQLGQEVLKLIHADSMGVIVTLHNNYNGGYSILSYKPGNYLENTAAAVFINPEMDADNFVFVTERRFFDYLSQAQINVVLQSKNAPDDGSLSVYAMQANIPYLNIEAQHGHFEDNYRMILLVNRMLEEIRPAGTPLFTKDKY